MYFLRLPLKLRCLRKKTQAISAWPQGGMFGDNGTHVQLSLNALAQNV
jgi:hypothetical protein